MSIFGKIIRAIFGGSGEDMKHPISRAELEKQIAKVSGASGPQNHWKTSIVDLLKLLDVPSDLDARQDLARELGYSGKIDDSEKLNTWLHKAVMDKLCETGGKVPESFKD